jgi:hypothetical protein
MTTKTPGRVAYEAYCATTDWKSLVSGAPLPQWSEVKPEIKNAWENAALAARRPVAIQVYNARRALARLLVTYRSAFMGKWYEASVFDRHIPRVNPRGSAFMGNWYEASVEAGGMQLDEFGFIKGPYKHDDYNQFGGPAEVEKIASAPILC